MKNMYLISIIMQFDCCYLIILSPVNNYIHKSIHGWATRVQSLLHENRYHQQSLVEVPTHILWAMC